MLSKRKRLNDSHVAYTHGSLNLFESAYQHKVIDIESHKGLNADIYIPFLFLQSGLKPIVEKKQIVEYAKFINALESSNTLVVVGYSFSIDDSEMVSIVRDFLEQENNKMVYFDFKAGDLHKPSLRTILRIDDESKIQRIEIDGQNSLEKFRSYLEEL